MAKKPNPVAETPADGAVVPLAERADTNGLIAITVIGPASGRRRAGFSFGANPLAVHVNEAQLALIKGDPDLSVAEGHHAVAESADKTVTDAPAARPPREAFLDKNGKPAAISVIGPAGGRRRAGRTFGREPSIFTPTEAELDAIIAEADLSVQPAKQTELAVSA
jgi:hypothetical protein